MPKVVISSHPHLQVENRLCLALPASPTETQQELVFNAPATYYRLQIRPQVSAFLEEQQREWKLNVKHDELKLYPVGPPERRNEPVFDANLRFGTNRLEVSLVAALPRGERGESGVGMELERFTIYFNLLRHN